MNLKLYNNLMEQQLDFTHGHGSITQSLNMSRATTSNPMRRSVKVPPMGNYRMTNKQFYNHLDAFKNLQPSAKNDQLKVFAMT